MPSAADAELPDIAAVLASLLARLSREDQPILIAMAERLAAERYRGWAAEPGLAGRRAELLACAEREEEIARRIEALRPDAEAVARDLRAKHPELLDINRSLFADRPLSQQLTLQARGERLGAATWRSFAGDADAAGRQVLLGCALLEEENAAVLEAILEG